MPARFYLNALVSEERRRLRAPKPGDWIGDAADGRFLIDYARDIQVPEALEEPDFLERVPSIFAWPMQYAAALEDPEHALHGAVKREWRGLLAAFALQNWLGTRVDWKPVVIPNSATSGEPKFVTILRNQLPKPVTEWHQWWLCYANGLLIGATSPWSVVYTPADYTCPEVFPFQANGRFIDPVTYYASRDAAYELELLAQWIHLVLPRFNWQMTRTAGHAAGVKDALEVWERDTAKALAALYARGIGSDARRQTWWLDTARAPIKVAPYQHFAMPVVPKDAGTSPDSDLLLATSRKRVVALSECGVDPKARVYRGTMGGAVDFDKLPGASGDANWEVKGGFRVPIGYVIPERLFFPPRLAAFAGQQEELTPEALATPLTPNFFELFGFAEMRGQIDRFLTVSFVPGREVIAELRLPLVGNRTLTVTRRYDVARDVVRISGGGAAFAVWPDFYTDDWKDNYAAYARREDDLGVAPLTDLGQVAQRSAAGDVLVRVWEMESPAIGFALFDRGDWTGASAVPLGVVLRGQPVAPAEIDGRLKWTVAIDFGTSSSHIMIDAGRGIDRLDLQGRTVVIKDRDPQGVLRDELEDALYPAGRVSAPFPTLLAQSRAVIRVVDGVPGRPKTVERVPWFSYRRMLRAQAGVQNVVFRDVKWHGETGESAPLRDYLRGLVRLVLAEARAQGVAQVGFEWSYPLSLPREARESMARFWAAVLPSFKGRQLAKLVETRGVSESEAACRFLATNVDKVGVPIAASALSVVIDVGGGSSDFGFWKAGQLVDQFSIKLAGNAVVGPLCELSGFRDALSMLATGSTSPVDLADAFRDRPEMFVTALLTELSDAPQSELYDPGLHPVARKLFDSDDERVAPWRYARTLVHIFFTGLAFMAGLVARRHAADRPEVKIYLGGRGASLLTWVTSETSDRARIINEAAAAGLAMSPPVQARSEVLGPVVRPVPGLLPKEEVVRGLLASSTRKEMPPRETTLLLESVWDPKQWDREVTIEVLDALDFPQSLDAGYMSSFLNQFLPKSTAGLGLDDENLTKLTGVDSATVEHMVRTERAILQPIFAFELRVVMQNYLMLVKRSG